MSTKKNDRQCVVNRKRIGYTNIFQLPSKAKGLMLCGMKRDI